MSSGLMVQATMMALLGPAPAAVFGMLAMAIDGRVNRAAPRGHAPQHRHLRAARARRRPADGGLGQRVRARARRHHLRAARAAGLPRAHGGGPRARRGTCPGTHAGGPRRVFRETGPADHPARTAQRHHGRGRGAHVGARRSRRGDRAARRPHHHDPARPRPGLGAQRPATTWSRCGRCPTSAPPR